MKKVNKINQFDQLDIKDVRWYSSIKNKIEALEQGYGTVEVILKIKSHETTEQIPSNRKRNAHELV